MPIDVTCRSRLSTRLRTEDVPREICDVCSESLPIQIPDELAERLEPPQERLPELLCQLVDTKNPDMASLAIAIANLQKVPPAYLEVIDFLMTRPTPQNILSFKVSSEAQERLS